MGRPGRIVIVRKDGIRQHYNVSASTKRRYVYDRHRRVHVERDKAIKNRMLDAMRDWGIGRKQIRPRLIDTFASKDVRYEGKGIWQIQVAEYSNGKSKTRLRYNEKRGMLDIYIRGYRYDKRVEDRP